MAQGETEHHGRTMWRKEAQSIAPGKGERERGRKAEVGGERERERDTHTEGEGGRRDMSFTIDKIYILKACPSDPPPPAIPYLATVTTQ